MNGDGLSGTATVVTALVALVFSAFFSGSETGYMSVSRARLRRSGRASTPRGRRLEEQLGRIEDPILTCLIGTNLANVLGSAVVTAALTARYGQNGEWLALLLVSATVIIFGEILPKVLYREEPERLTLASVPLVTAFMTISGPVRVVLRGYTTMLRRLLPAGGADGGLLDRRNLAALLLTNSMPTTGDRRFAETLDRYLRLAGMPLERISRPLAAIVTVGPEATVSECLAVAARSGHSRLPVTSEDGRTLQGYLSVRDLMFLPAEDQEMRVPRRLWRSFLLVDGRMSAYEVFEELRSRARQMAVVTDADGNPRGLITLEDLIETVVGSIDDEFDGTPVREAGPTGEVA